MAAQTNPINFSITGRIGQISFDEQLGDSIRKGDVEKVKALLTGCQRGLHRIHYQRESINPLSILFFLNPEPNAEITRLLLKQGANPLSGDPHQGREAPLTSLFSAAEYNNLEKPFSLPRAMQVLTVLGEIKDGKPKFIVGREIQEEIINNVIFRSGGGKGFIMVSQMVEFMKSLGMVGAEEGNEDLLTPALNKQAKTFLPPDLSDWDLVRQEGKKV